MSSAQAGARPGKTLIIRFTSSKRQIINGYLINNSNMKRQFLAIAAVAASLAGCTSKLEPATEPEGEGIFATIEQPALPIQTKTLSWDTDKLKFTWGTNENVVVFGREGNKGKADAALLRTLTAGEASSKLESKGFQLMDGINYYAFIPAYNFNITTDDITNIPLTFEGQRQGSSSTTSHLNTTTPARQQPRRKARTASNSNSRTRSAG